MVDVAGLFTLGEFLAGAGLATLVVSFLILRQTRTGRRSGCGGRDRTARVLRTPTWYDQEAIRVAPWQLPIPGKERPWL